MSKAERGQRPDPFENGTYTRVDILTNTILAGTNNAKERDAITDLKDSAVNLLLVTPDKFFFSGTQGLQESFSGLRKRAAKDKLDGTITTDWRLLRNKTLAYVLSLDLEEQVAPGEVKDKVRDIRERYTGLQKSVNARKN